MYAADSEFKMGMRQAGYMFTIKTVVEGSCVLGVWSPRIPVCFPSLGEGVVGARAPK